MPLLPPFLPQFYPALHHMVTLLYPIFTLILAPYFTLQTPPFYPVFVYNVEWKIPRLSQSYPSPSLFAPPSVLPQCWYFMRSFNPNFNPGVKQVYLYQFIGPTEANLDESVTKYLRCIAAFNAQPVCKAPCCIHGRLSSVLFQRTLRRELVRNATIVDYMYSAETSLYTHQLPL